MDFIGFFNWFKDREEIENEKRLNENPKYRDPQLEAVKKAALALLPKFKDLRIKRDPLRMVIIKGKAELSINQLSDGEKCLLTMTGDLARRFVLANPSLKNPLSGDGIVLIDELELHLHPRWQRGILPGLCKVFPNCQFVVTTHSPQIVGDIQASNVYILKPKGNSIKITHPEVAFGRDSNQILEEVMGVSERPQAIKENLQQLFRHIAEGDLESARLLQQKLSDLIGSDEPEFAKADVLIRRKEILGK